MDGKLPQGVAVRGGASSYGGFDLQGPLSQHLQGLPFTMVSGQTCGHHLSEQHKGERESDDDEQPSFNEEATKGSPWQRVKWTDKMVKLLITAVSYIGDDSSMDGGGRRKFAALQKKGKWKSVSKVMSERGYHVSPQQCEDKFNDLNKRYKKLNDMLGRGTSCQVVENPKLLDSIGYLNDKEKDDGHVNSLECNKVTLALPQGGAESGRSASVQKQWIESRTLQLEEQKLQIQVELLELEKQRFRWERFSKKRDQELERMRMENERMKLENDRMGLELKQRVLGVEL
ncbi:hypothetical protein HID58_030664 [Brassica napus]|uniref:Myb/SANT-like DNA-binding domain-containing protein n=1 Tax=Brassica napus TaxID=3708 RepID=A0ABQ8CGP3_BRANA|nr:hypothetical protein HID58_030664 [Brassica napus]